MKVISVFFSFFRWPMRSVLLLSIFLILSRCGKDIPPPTYLIIEDFVLEENIDVDYGQLTHGILDVYVYIDNQAYGVFPVPCQIPLNLEGSHELRLTPAVRSNGQSGAKIRYPFFEPFEQEVTFTRLDTLTVSPKTRYYSTTIVEYEDFEDAAVQLESTTLANVSMQKSSDPSILEPRNGNFFGLVNLNETENFWDAITNSNWSFQPNRPVFLEIDFYNTNPIQTGLRSSGSSGVNVFPHVLIVAQETSELRWRKMYIDLSTLVSQSGFGATFNLMLTSVLEEGKSEGLVAIDNIKLVTR